LANLQSEGNVVLINYHCQENFCAKSHFGKRLLNRRWGGQAQGAFERLKNYLFAGDASV
jgi:hypothetical protein